MYEKKEFSSTEYLFMWKNRPAIVCGKHQNPWLEANVPLASSLGLDVARRSSGGGTVYHDQGNLNLSFLKSRENYNRRKNLDLVVQAITDKWNIDLTVNGRDDILLNKFYKVSGTAAKLGRLKSYHHFTLLHSVNQDLLQRSLQSPMQGASSKSTKSFPSSVMNLVDQAPGINFEFLVNTIGQHFLAETAQEIQPETFLYVNPLDEEEFLGVSEINDRLRTWDWRTSDVRPGGKTQRIAPTLQQAADLVCTHTKERECFKTCIVGHVNCCLQIEPTLTMRNSEITVAELSFLKGSKTLLTNSITCIPKVHLHGLDTAVVHLHGLDTAVVHLHGPDTAVVHLHGPDIAVVHLHGSDTAVVQLHAAVHLHGPDTAVDQPHGSENAKVHLHGPDTAVVHLQC
ncbi:lipoyltransferase 1, mitochondrial [Plakobranchus ocellatus]|uniref:Lipoyltransferase 1, mitochondrial n=1 Tax=Plakobranchus ocellatus TaxID=259542 RepID=A0AAV3ZBQ8_9GAST|nr:lipoyltransferase 1, mitochondrial [Plakobranchus ocellatus]